MPGSAGLTSRPELSEHDARDVLQGQLGWSADSVRELPDGHVSRAFSFMADGEPFVIRFARTADGYLRDDLAHRMLNRPGVPVPNVLAMGTCPHGQYAVSECAPGTSLKRMPEREHRALVPGVVRVLLALSEIEPSEPGWGYWDSAGFGTSGSWAGHMLEILEPADSGYYAGWTRLLHTGELDPTVWNRLAARLRRRLAELGDVPRGVVHSDFGGDNMIALGAEITGVIDWGLAGYGDPLYDLANLTFWYPDMGFGEEFLRQVPEGHPALHQFDARLGAYELQKATLSLRFYALTGMREAYDWTRRRVDRIP